MDRIKISGASEAGVAQFFDFETGEQINADTLIVNYLVYDQEAGVFQAGFRFGGYRSDGEFVVSPAHSVAQNKIYWPRGSAEWNEYDLDNFVQLYAETANNVILRWIYEKDMIRILAEYARIKVTRTTTWIEDDKGSLVLGSTSSGEEKIPPITLPEIEDVK